MPENSAQVMAHNLSVTERINPILQIVFSLGALMLYAL